MQRNQDRMRVLPLLAPLLLVAAPSFAQTFRGNINGSIVDPSGAVVAGA